MIRKFFVYLASAWGNRKWSPPASLLLDGLSGSRGRWGFGRSIVVSRSRCRIKFLELAGVPVAERLSAARLQAVGWRAFDDQQSLIALSAGRGFVVAWDRASAESVLADAGLDARRIEFVPEVFFQEVGSDGPRLVRSLEGFEGQVWSAGVLIASRWWAGMPSEDEWEFFARASGLGPQFRSLPKLQDTHWRRAHWTRPLSLSPGGRLGRLEYAAVAVGLAAICALLVHLGRQVWDATARLSSLSAEVVAVKQRKEEVVALRERVLSQGDELAGLSEWLTGTHPLEVLVHLESSLRKSGALVRELDISGTSVRLGLQLSAQSSRSAVLRDLQGGGWLTGVSELPDQQRGLMVVEAGLRRDRGPAVSAGSPSGVPAASPPPGQVAPGQPGVATK